jgi:hypothetical protein
MTAKTKKLFAKIQSWPPEDQEELAEIAREIESRRTGIYLLSDEERFSVREGLDAAKHGDFAPEEQMEEFYRLHRGV